MELKVEESVDKVRSLTANVALDELAEGVKLLIEEALHRGITADGITMHPFRGKWKIYLWGELK